MNIPTVIFAALTLAVFAAITIADTPVGKYKYSYSSITADVTVTSVDGNIVMSWKLFDGSKMRHELIEIQEQGEIRLVKKGGRKFGEYFVATEKGIGVYDSQGYITTMQRVE